MSDNTVAKLPDIRLIQGDYRRHLPDRENTYIITDPPYNVGYKYPDYDDNQTRNEYLALLQPLVGYKAVIIHYPEVLINDVCWLLGEPEKCVAWIYNSNTPRQWRMAAWFNCKPDFSKIKQPYKNLDDRRVMELIQAGSEGCSLYDWWNIDLVKNVSGEKVGYVNQIPEEVIRRILLTTVPEGGRVFEPFCGSGTTPVVARRFGYDCTATDISAEAIRIAQQRLDALELPFAEGL